MSLNMTEKISTENWDHDSFYFISRSTDDALLLELKLNNLTPLLEYLSSGGDANKRYEQGSLLHYAIVYKQPLLVSALLQAGASANALDCRDISALQMAVYIDDSDIVKTLLETGANINFRSSSSLLDQSILHEAAARSSYEIVKLLLDYRADVNAIDCGGNGALYRAVLRMKDEDSSSCHQVEKILELLISRGADLFSIGLGGNYYLVEALAQCGTMRALQLFLDNGIKLQDFRNKPLLFHAFQNEHKGVLEFLIQTNIFNVDQRDADGRTLLQRVIASSNELGYTCSLVKLLLDRGANVNVVDDQGNEVLYYAVLKVKESSNDAADIEALLELLISHGARSSNAGYNGNKYLLENLLQLGTAHALQLFLSSGIRLENYRYQPLLFHALKNKHGEVLDFLLETDTLNINQRDANGRTLLQYAIVRSKDLRNILLLAETLINRGVDVNAADNQGFDALYYAALKVKDDSNDDSDTDSFLKLLISRGAQVINPGPEGSYSSFETVVRYGSWTTVQIFLDNGINIQDLPIQPLLYSALDNDGHKEVLEYLLEMVSFDTDQKDSEGNTFLHHAIKADKSLNDIELILRHHADPNTPDGSGKTPLFTALSKNCGPLVEMLLEYGAYIDSHHYWEIPVLAALKTRSSRCIRSDILVSVISHVTQLDSQGCAVDPVVLEILSSKNDWSGWWYKACKNELELLRSSKIYRNVSFYQILVKRDIYGIVDNQCVMDALNDRRIFEKFPIYGKRMTRRFDRIRERKKFLAGAMTGLGHVMKINVEGFQFVVHNILHWLRRSDLIKLCQVSLETSSSD